MKISPFIYRSISVALLLLGVILFWQAFLNRTDPSSQVIEETAAMLFFWGSVMSIVLGSFLLFRRSPNWLMLKRAVFCFEMLLISFLLSFTLQWFFWADGDYVVGFCFATALLSLIFLKKYSRTNSEKANLILTSSLVGGAILTAFNWLGGIMFY